MVVVVVVVEVVVLVDDVVVVVDEVVVVVDEVVVVVDDVVVDDVVVDEVVPLVVVEPVGVVVEPDDVVPPEPPSPRAWAFSRSERAPQPQRKRVASRRRGGVVRAVVGRAEGGMIAWYARRARGARRWPERATGPRAGERVAPRGDHMQQAIGRATRQDPSLALPFGTTIAPLAAAPVQLLQEPPFVPFA